MLKDFLKKVAPEFNILAEEMKEIEQNVINKLDKSAKLDEIDCVTFGLETDDGKIIKVYVNSEQSAEFEKALSEKLGQVDDIEEALNELAKDFEIVDVEWPEDGDEEDAEVADSVMTTDGSESLNSQVYDKKNAESEKDHKIKQADESIKFTPDEEFSMKIFEADHTNSLESRLTTPVQLMVYNAILDLGIPEIALVRNPYRTAIIKGIREKALELNKNPTIKTALKWFIKRSLDQDSLLKKKKQDAKHTRDDDEDVKEGVECPMCGSSELHEAQKHGSKINLFWDDMNKLISYIAVDKDTAETLFNATKYIALQKASITSDISRSSTLKIRQRLSELVELISSSEVTASPEAVTESTNAVEMNSVLTSLLQAADASAGKKVSEQLLDSTLFKQFMRKSKVKFTQKFRGELRVKLNQLLKQLGLKSTEDEKVTEQTLTELVKDDAKWMFTKDGEIVTISCKDLEVKLADEEMEKLLKAITNNETAVIRDHEDPTKKFTFSPRQRNVHVKQIGSPDVVVMKAEDVEKLTDTMTKMFESKTDSNLAIDWKTSSPSAKAFLSKLGVTGDKVEDASVELPNGDEIWYFKVDGVRYIVSDDLKSVKKDVSESKINDEQIVESIGPKFKEITKAEYEKQKAKHNSGTPVHHSAGSTHQGEDSKGNVTFKGAMHVAKDKNGDLITQTYSHKDHKLPTVLHVVGSDKKSRYYMLNEGASKLKYDQIGRDEVAVSVHDGRKFKLSGSIKKVAGGYQYFPQGKKEGGEVCKTINDCKKTLESD